MQDDATAGAGQSDKPGQPFDPSKPEGDEREQDAEKNVDSPRDVPIGLPVTEREYSRLKEDAARGKPLRQRRVQEDP